MKLWLLFIFLVFFATVCQIILCEKRESEVLNGEIVEKRVPFIVHLKIKYLTIDLYDPCGGSFLNERFIVTAGHCLQFKRDIVKLLYGNNVINDFRGGTEQTIKRIIYPNLDLECLHYDIGVIELEVQNQVIFNDLVTAVKLNTKKLLPDSIVHALGWGATSTSTALSNVLLRTTEKVVGMEKCQPVKSNCSITTTDTAQFCATSVDQVNCPGDSGGPVINEANELCGLVSANAYWSVFGVGAEPLKCQTSAEFHPNSIYTAISDVHEWINRQTIQTELYVWGFTNLNLWGSMPTKTQISSSQLNTFNTQISPIMKKIHIPYGNNFVLGISYSKRLYTWGPDPTILGYGTSVSFLQPESSTFLNISNVKDICGGYRHGIALTEDNLIYGWGDNSKNQVDPGDSRKWIPIPQLINLRDSPKILGISCGAEHTIARAKDRLYTWGSNQYGQLGQNTLGSCLEDSSRYGNETLELKDISMACTGPFTTLVVINKLAYVFGSNVNGIAGIGFKTPSSICTPHWIGFNDTKEVYCGESNMFIKDSDSIYGWGSNTRKIIIDSADFVTVPTLTNIKGTNLVIGAEHVLFQNDKKWYGVGSNEYGQLTRTDIANSVKPVEIQFLNSRPSEVYSKLEVTCRGHLCMASKSSQLQSISILFLLSFTIILNLL